jgi:hypothetical protein
VLFGGAWDAAGRQALWRRRAAGRGGANPGLLNPPATYWAVGGGLPEHQGLDANRGFHNPALTPGWLQAPLLTAPPHPLTPNPRPRGDGWGDKGFIRMRMGRGKAGLCGIASQPSYPLKTGPNPPAPPPGPTPPPKPAPGPAPAPPKPDPEPVECDDTHECPAGSTCCCLRCGAAAGRGGRARGQGARRHPPAPRARGALLPRARGAHEPRPPAAGAARTALSEPVPSVPVPWAAPLARAVRQGS